MFTFVDSLGGFPEFDVEFGEFLYGNSMVSGIVDELCAYAGNI